MSKKSAIVLLVIALAGGGYYYYRTQLSCSFLDAGRMKVAGKQQDCWPKDAREKAGYDLRRVPDRDNAAVLYVKASNLLKKANGASAIRWVSQNEACLKLIHKAVRKPKCEFPIFGSDHDCAYAMALPMLSPMRGFACLLASEGERYEKHGEYDKALECYFVITRLSGHVRESNSVLITELVTVACQAIRDAAVEECLSSDKLGESQLRRIIEHYVHAVEVSATFVEALRSEKRVLDATIAEMVRRPELGERMLGQIAGGAPAGGSRALVRVLSEHGSELQQDFNRSFDALVTWGGMPNWVALRPGNDFGMYLSGLPDTCLFSKMLLPSLSKARKKFVWGQAQARGVLVFAAIKLYEKKNGRPPASLAELKGDYLSELPKDPFSGNDYVYKVRGKDWILYSVWDNLTDDNGAGSWPHKYSDDKDFVWCNTKIAVE